MKATLAAIIERAVCTCWLTSHDWIWCIPTWPGRDEDGFLLHSIGSTLWSAESRILCVVIDWYPRDAA